MRRGLLRVFWHAAAGMAGPGKLGEPVQRGLRFDPGTFSFLTADLTKDYAHASVWNASYAPRPSASNSAARWLSSQNGLSFDRPQRHNLTKSVRSIVR